MKRTWIIYPLLCILTFAATWHLASVRWAVADPPSLVDAQEPGLGIGAAPLVDGGIANPVPVTAPATPDPEGDLGAFLRIVWTVGKTSIPAAAVFVVFAIVTIARRRWPPAREGTTGVLTATLLTALTYAVSMLATGASVGTALGGAVIALLTGRAMAMQPAVKP